MNPAGRVVIHVFVASVVVLGPARGEVRGAKVAPSIAATQRSALVTETMKLARVGSRTTTPMHLVSFGPMSAMEPAPLNTLAAGEFELTDDDATIFLDGTFVQDGAKFTLAVDTVSTVTWLLNRLPAVPGVTAVHSLSFRAVTAKGKVYTDGSGFRWRTKLKFRAEVSYDLGAGVQKEILNASYAMDADTAP